MIFCQKVFIKARLHHKLIGLSVAAISFFANCTKDHHPEKHHAAIKEERLTANQPVPKLASDGSLAQTSAAQSSGNPKYDSLCASCHGSDGKADTAAAKALTPRPRAFVDEKWQAGVDDARIAKVIKEGGVSVGLSPMMAPWGGTVSDTEITALVATIRAFGKAK